MKGRRTSSAQRIPFFARLTAGALYAALTLTQLAFGGIHAWTYAKLAMALGLLVCLLMPFVLLRAAGPQGLRLHLPPLTLHALLFLLLALLQITPLPQALVASLDPALPRLFVAPLHIPDHMTLSINARDSVVEMLRWLPLAMSYFLAMYALRTSRQAVRLVWVLVLLGLFQGAYGIYQTYGGGEQVWNWAKTLHRGYVTGTYISRNELAYFLEVAVLTALGTSLGLYTAIPESRRGLHNERLWKIGLLGFSAIILAVVLLLSGSRGGILSCSLGLICMAGMFMTRKAMRGAGTKIMIVSVLILVYGLAAGLEKTAERFEHDSDLIHRFEIAASVLPMIADHPLTGVGLGTFNTAYEPYALPQYGADLDVVHAHNDWIEIAAETGLPGLALCASGYILFLSLCLRQWRRRNNALVLGIGAGGICALVSLGAHSFFDFGMRVPANELTVGMLCAMLWNVLHMHGSGDLVRRLPALGDGRVQTAGIMFAAVVILAGSALFTHTARVFDQAERLCPTRRTVFDEPSPPLTRILKAHRLVPEDPAYTAAMAGRIMELYYEARVLPSAFHQAAVLYREALQGDPANGLIWRQYALTLAMGTEYPLGRSWHSAAREAFLRALEIRPHDPETYFAAAQYELWSWLQNTGGTYPDALRLLHTTLELKPGMWRQVVDLAAGYGAGEEDLLSLLPSPAQPWQLNYLTKKLGKKSAG